MAKGFLSWMRARGLMLAMLALALKAAIPAGFMLSQPGQGAPQIVLCTGHGAATLDPETGAFIPYDPAAQQTRDGERGDAPVQTCPFAALAFASPAPSPVALPPARAPLVRIAAESVGFAIAFTQGPPLPARGPPQSA